MAQGDENFVIGSGQEEREPLCRGSAKLREGNYLGRLEHLLGRVGRGES